MSVIEIQLVSPILSLDLRAMIRSTDSSEAFSIANQDLDHDVDSHEVICGFSRLIDCAALL